MTKYGRLNFTRQKNGNLKGYMDWYDASGKRHVVSKTSKSKKKREAKAEIEAWAEEVRKQGEKGLYLGKKNNSKTVEEVVTEFFNHQLDTGKLERSTYRTQINRCKKHVFPYIGSNGFNEVNRDVLEIWITKLYNSNLTEGTIHGIYSDVAKVYKHYFKKGELLFNPFEFVDTPSKSKSKKTYLSPEQMKIFNKTLEESFEPGDSLYTAIQLAMLAGLRRGEICGLRWFDIDFSRNSLTISSSIGVADRTYTKGPKNLASKRTFPMVSQLHEALSARLKAVEKEYGTHQADWFVCGKAKKYLSPTSLSRKFKQFVTNNELVDFYGNELKLHSLRHNFATQGVKAHIDIASLSRMMGHASKAMTLDTYADSSPEAMKIAVKQLESSFEEES